MNTQASGGLRVRTLSVSYQGITAVSEANLDIPAGTCVAVVGANGAGKTSMLRGISGLARTSRRSEVWLGNTRVDQRSAEARAKMGMGHVLEGRHIFPHMTVLENLQLGVGRVGRDIATRRLSLVFDMFPEISRHAKRRGGALSGGQQQLLAIGRALMGEPTALLLDEPSTGLAPGMMDRIVETIRAVVAMETAVLLAEQSLDLVHASASRAHVLSHGRSVWQGPVGKDLNDAVKEAYLS